ncbi:hypothetical protein BJX63DRAFT_438541 [Aspergillus granulosus]|uniref:Uncharacterized protein n=1 Tax=Aspergillus granulosus TaxID=176169 RepID=A0ABR4GRP0_9EURO
MLTLNIELLESKTRPDARPEAIARLRSMRGDPKTTSCFNYVMEVLSTFNPAEVSQFLEDARKTSKSVSTFQVWSETSLQIYYPNQDEELFGFIDTENLGSPLLGDRRDHNLARFENLEHSQYTPSIVPQLASGSTLLGPVNRFPHAGEKPDHILDGIYNSDECMPPSGLVNAPCSDPVATPVSVAPPQFVHQTCWYSTYSQTVPPELLGYGGLDMALLEWIFQPAPAQLALEPTISDDEFGKEPSQIRQMTFAPVIEDVVFKPLDSALLSSNNRAALALKATVVPSKIGDWPYWWHI